MLHKPSSSEASPCHDTVVISEINRKVRRSLLRSAILLSGLILSLAYAAAVFLGGGPRGVAAGQNSDTPAVIELFTSQGCYSCPPAEALLGELVETYDLDKLIALEFHVDYWDSLVYGSHGSHQDPFSSPDNSLRQRAYNNVELEGQRGVYTPQMVVNGRYAAIGSRRGHVVKGIEVVERPSIVIDIDENSADEDALNDNASFGQTSVRIQLSGDHSQVPDDARLWLAVFDIEESTTITTGENHDKTLVSHHIVREFKQVMPPGDYSERLESDGNLQLDVDITLDDGQGCAVLLQESALGAVHGASYCPKSMWKAAAS